MTVLAERRKVYRIGEAAELLGVHPNSIRKAEWRGAIPAARREPWGDDRVFTPNDLDTLRRYFDRSG